MSGKIFRDNLRNPLSILLLQLVVIIVAARLVGKLFQKIGQPPVLGEIVAGIVLGPSLLGWLSPETMAFLFPASSMETLKLLSQIGVALFMFVVGMELDVRHLRQKAHTAIMVSHASIIVPFFLGTALSLFVYRSLAPAKTSFTAFALFMGIAMSITAFPVLARILEDRGMSQTYLGSIALTCAAVDDVTAWCMLALVIAFAQSGSLAASFLTIVLASVFHLRHAFDNQTSACPSVYGSVKRQDRIRSETFAGRSRPGGGNSRIRIDLRALHRGNRYSCSIWRVSGRSGDAFNCRAADAS